MKLNFWRSFGLALASLSFAAAVNAEPSAWLDVGVKGGVGGNYLSTPGGDLPDTPWMRASSSA